MMPRAEAFAVAMRELGVSSDKHPWYTMKVISSAPRARRMLRTFGAGKGVDCCGWLKAGAAMGYRWSKAFLNCRKGF